MQNVSIIVVSLIALLLASCTTGDVSPSMTANPPPFDFEDGEALRSDMHRLAYAVQQLDRVLARESEDQPPVRQSPAIDYLEEIEDIARGLQAREIRTDHPFLVEKMERFLSDINRAQFYASRGSYYMAGRVTGACASCHQAVY